MASDLVRLLSGCGQSDDDVGRALIRSLNRLHTDLGRLDRSLTSDLAAAVKDVLEVVLEAIDHHADAVNARLEALERTVAACVEGQHP